MRSWKGKRAQGEEVIATLGRGGQKRESEACPRRAEEENGRDLVRGQPSETRKPWVEEGSWESGHPAEEGRGRYREPLPTETGLRAGAVRREF